MMRPDCRSADVGARIGYLISCCPPRSKCRLVAMERMRPASVSRAALIRWHSSRLSEPPPSSNVQILNLLTPEIRANLLCEMPRDSRLDRRLIIYRYCCGGRVPLSSRGKSREVAGKI
jgi:hypothetical protein